MIESTAMDKWMSSQFRSNKSPVELPTCPMCKRSIHSHVRYSDLIKPKLALIEQIKRQEITGEPSQIRKVKKDQLADIDKFKLTSPLVVFKPDFAHVIYSEVENRTVESLTLGQLIGYRNAWSIFLQLNDCFRLKSERISRAEQSEHLDYEMNRIVELIYDRRHTKAILPSSHQRAKCISAEIERIRAVIYFYQIMNVKSGVSVKLQNDLEGFLIRRVNRFESSAKDDANAKINALAKMLNKRIEQTEKKMAVLKGVNLKKENWFSCANGHIYFKKSECPHDC